MAGVQTILAFVGGGWPAHAAPRQGHRHDGAGGRPPRVEAFGACALFQKLQGPSGHRQGDALGLHGLRLVQSPQASRRDHATKNTGHCCGVKTRFVKHATSHHAHAGGHLHAGHISQQQILTGAVLLASDAESGGKHRCSGMDHAAGVGVVVIQAMDQQAIDQGRIAGWQMGLQAKYRDRACAGAQVLHRQKCLLGKRVAP